MDYDSYKLYSEYASWNSSNDSNWSGGIFPDVIKLDKTWLTYYLMGIGGVCVCCLGTIANTMSLMVLMRRSMILSTYTYLSALSISDICVLVATLMLLINDTREPRPTSSDPMLFYIFTFPYVHPIAVTFQTTSIWIVLGFTVDRYIMICHPFTSERLCTIQRARQVSVCLYIGALIFSIPRFFEYKTVIDTISVLNITKTSHYIDLTTIGKHPLYRIIVHSWMYLLCVYGLPFLTLAVLNAFLIRAVHLSKKRGREINAVEKKRNDTTVMLISVVLIFFVCQFPALIARMLYAANMSVRFGYSYRVYSEIGNFLVVLNSAINIVPYYFFGKKFQKEFWLLFCSMCLSPLELNRRFSDSMEFRRNTGRFDNIKQAQPLTSPTHNGVSSGSGTKITDTGSPNVV